jgi:hypothetical protein
MLVIGATTGRGLTAFDVVILIWLFVTADGAGSLRVPI